MHMHKHKYKHMHRHKHKHKYKHKYKHKRKNAEAGSCYPFGVLFLRRPHSHTDQLPGLGVAYLLRRSCPLGLLCA